MVYESRADVKKNFFRQLPRKEARSKMLTTMAKRKKKPEPRSRKQFHLRLSPALRQAIEALAARNESTVTAEITRAIVRLVTEEGLWPPPTK